MGKSKDAGFWMPCPKCWAGVHFSVEQEKVVKLQCDACAFEFLITVDKGKWKMEMGEVAKVIDENLEAKNDKIYGDPICKWDNELDGCAVCGERCGEFEKACSKCWAMLIELGVDEANSAVYSLALEYAGLLEPVDILEVTRISEIKVTPVPRMVSGDWVLTVNGMKIERGAEIDVVMEFDSDEILHRQAMQSQSDALHVGDILGVRVKSGESSSIYFGEYLRLDKDGKMIVRLNITDNTGRIIQVYNRSVDRFKDSWFIRECPHKKPEPKTQVITPLRIDNDGWPRIGGGA